MKTTPDNIAAWSRLAEDDDYDLPAGIVRALIADLEEAQQDLATADECWVFFQDLCKAHGCDGIIAMAAELTATRKQLEEAQAKLAAETQRADDAWTNTRAIEKARQEEMAKRDAAEAKLAAAEKDVRRVDALDRECIAYGYEELYEGNSWSVEGPFATVRAALDATLAAQEGK